MKNYENIYQQIFNKDITIKKRSLSFTKFSIDSENFALKNKHQFNDIKKIGNYILGKKLGQGTFGIVVLAKHEITGENVAIKILDKDKIVRESDKTRLEREIRIMKSMYHNNIVHLYQVIENLKELFIVMEYISGKELFDYIIHKKHLDELESCKFYQQIISGIEYLGKTKVAHRDLKPENLLLDSKKNIKIVDFGLSNTYFQDELLSTACGSPCYAAPEMLSGEKYNGINIDIWSSGIVLYAMLCGYLPFEDNDNPKLYKKIIKGIFETPDFISPYAVDLLHRILNVDPEKRYTIEQIKEHPWFNQINPKLNMSEGLLIDYYIVPFDEDIINQMVNEYSFNEQQIKVNLLINKHNHITATYYLILKKKIRMGKKTIGDMTSQLFIDYIKDERNLSSSYDFDISSIIIDRVLNKIKIKSEKNENKIDLRKDEKIENTQFKYYENNISKIKNTSVQKKTNISSNEKQYTTVDKEKLFDTLENEKVSSDKQVKVKNKKNTIKAQNLMNYFEPKKHLFIKRDNMKNHNRKKIKSLREREKIYLNNNKKIIKKKSNKNNTSSQKCFYTTFNENNLKNLSQTNDDISLDENNNKQIINRISLLKESIIKSMTNKNDANINNTNITNTINNTNKNIVDNSKEINFTTNFSPTHTQTNCFSNKNIFKKIKPDLSNNKNYPKETDNDKDKKYLKIENFELIKDNKKLQSSNERYKKIDLPTTPFLNNSKKSKGQHEIIRIIQRIKNKAKEMDTNTIVGNSNNAIIFPSRSNFTRTHFYVNSASRVSRTPNNTARNFTNKIIFEHNLNNELNKKIYEINLGDNKNNIINKDEKNNNNIMNNNNNNINIHINLTNIYKNIRPIEKIKDNKDESVFDFNKNKIKLIQNKERKNKNKNINEIMRQNKFIDNNIHIKNRKFFINTSVSIEKKNDDKCRKGIESENKENRFLINRMTTYNKHNIINNFISNIDKTHDNEETSIQRKEKDNKYLKIKSKNKKFHQYKINKINSVSNKNKLEKNEFNEIINNLQNSKNNLIRIKKKNTISNKNFNDEREKNINHMSINFPSFCKISHNSSNIKINNTNNKLISKKSIYNTKQVFKSLNTDFYQNDKLTTTDFNFFSTKNNNNITNFDFYRDRIITKNKNPLNKILSERLQQKSSSKKIEEKKNYNFLKPFDLNSIVYVNKDSDIRDIVGKSLKVKNINYNEINYKYTCYKKELKFDINILNVNELEGAYIVKSFQKPVKFIKLKYLYYNTIFKLINNIK